MTSISGELEIMITSSLFLYQPNSSPRDVWREDRSLDISVPFFTILLKFFPKICGSIVKRILNRYLLFISKYENELAKYDNLNTVRLIILAEYFPSLFQLFLKDASAVKVELIKIGDSEFDVKQFEGKFGVSIAAIYPQLSRMNKLFNLELPIDDIKPNLTEHAQAVFSITRLT